MPIYLISTNRFKMRSRENTFWNYVKREGKNVEAGIIKISGKPNEID